MNTRKILATASIFMVLACGSLGYLREYESVMLSQPSGVMVLTEDDDEVLQEFRQVSNFSIAGMLRIRSSDLAFELSILSAIEIDRIRYTHYTRKSLAARFPDKMLVRLGSLII